MRTSFKAGPLTKGRRPKVIPSFLPLFLPREKLTLCDSKSRFSLGTDSLTGSPRRRSIQIYPSLTHWQKDHFRLVIGSPSPLRLVALLLLSVQGSAKRQATGLLFASTEQHEDKRANSHLRPQWQRFVTVQHRKPSLPLGPLISHNLVPAFLAL